MRKFEKPEVRFLYSRPYGNNGMHSGQFEQVKGHELVHLETRNHINQF